MRIKHKTSSYINVFKHPLTGVSIQNWVRILVANKFQFKLLYLPKVLLISIIALLNSPLQLLEFIILNRSIKRQKLKEPLFIIGHPRSGTTYLHYLLSRDEQFGYCSVYNALLPHTYLGAGRLFKGIVGLSLPKTRPQDNMKLTINSPKEEEFAMANITNVSFMFGFYFPKRARQNFSLSVLFSEKGSADKWKINFKYFLGKLSMSNRGRTLLLKSPANTGRIKEILELYPDAKFVHIHRNPEEVFQSTIHLYEKIIPETGFQSATRDEVKEFVLWSYKEMYNKYFREIELLNDDQLVSLDYDELVKNPMDTLESVYSKLNYSISDNARKSILQEISEAHGYVKNKHQELTENDKVALKEYWSEIKDLLGY